MVIVDTTVWVDFFNKKSNAHTNWLDQELSSYAVGLTDLTLCEVLQGVRDDAQFNTIRIDLADLAIFSIHEEIAVLAAQNYRWLRKRGITIRKTIDCLTATFCIVEGHWLLHKDRDFDPFQKHLGLKVILP